VAWTPKVNSLKAFQRVGNNMFRQLWFKPSSIRVSTLQKESGMQLTGIGMGCEQSKYPELRLQRLLELRWQREIIECWLDCPGTPAESQAQLQEMLTHVKSELQALEAALLINKTKVNPKRSG
jgi:hypothetical protein